MIKRLIAWLRLRLRGLFDSSPIRLAIVRRYIDANGSYVGELYIERAFNQASAYCMVGVSLDTLPLELESPLHFGMGYVLDTHNDFLVLMPPGVVRVGALTPADNDRVRKMVGKLPRHRITLVIQNRFIEKV